MVRVLLKTVSTETCGGHLDRQCLGHPSKCKILLFQQFSETAFFWLPCGPLEAICAGAFTFDSSNLCDSSR